jgi:hypothetical protein
MWKTGAPVDPITDLARIVETGSTITSLSLLFPLPVEFADEFCSRPNMAPALEYLGVVLQPNDPSGVNVQSFMQAIESQWHDGRLESVKVFLRILERMEVLSAEGLQVDLLYSTIDSIQHEVPSELIAESAE